MDTNFRVNKRLRFVIKFLLRDRKIRVSDLRQYTVSLCFSFELVAELRTDIEVSTLVEGNEKVKSQAEEFPFPLNN